MAVSLSLSTMKASLPMAWRLYLPEAWAQDKERRKATGVPEELGFQTKPEIALQQIRTAVDRQIPPAPVLADAGYGNDTKFREGITEAGLSYVVGIQSSLSVWKPGQAPLPKRKWNGMGRPTETVKARSTASASLGAARWRWVCLPRLGRTWSGVKGPVNRCVPALQLCAYALRIAITG